MRVALLLVVLLLAPPAVCAAECLAPPAEMRRSHMDLLAHDRSAAAREGIRRPGHGLDDCITCHVVRDAGGAAVDAADLRHFCTSCHVKVAVSVDCFSCHRATPGEAAR